MYFTQCWPSLLRIWPTPCLLFTRLSEWNLEIGWGLTTWHTVCGLKNVKVQCVSIRKQMCMPKCQLYEQCSAKLSYASTLPHPYLCVCSDRSSLLSSGVLEQPALWQSSLSIHSMLLHILGPGESPQGCQSACHFLGEKWLRKVKFSSWAFPSSQEGWWIKITPWSWGLSSRV